MKIAVAVLSNNENSEISEVAGRAPFYLIYENKKLIETINNPFRFGSGGAGPSVAKMLADKGINLVIAGKFGGNMTSALKEKNIAYKETTGKAIDAL